MAKKPANGKPVPPPTDIVVDEKAGTFRVPVRIEMADVVFPFSNHQVVQHDEHGIYISFIQVRPPVIVADTDAERIEAIKQLKGVTGKCVAGVVIAKNQMQAFIGALQTILKASDAPGKVKDEK
ncbi:MAG: hypothetical protein HYS13_24810 [Planctomycetia bacterium]|nr:hypothetical protein [Planctomycetia bacterium]